MKKSTVFSIVAVIILITTGSQGSEPDLIAIEADTSRQLQEAFIYNIEEKVRSTLLFGGSSPVGFSGEGRIKIQYHNMVDYPPFMRTDRSWIQSGWEGNQAFLRLGMIVSMGRNVTLYSKIGFQNTLPGVYINDTAGKGQGKVDPGFVPVQNRHDKTKAPAYIHEDMTGGIALRTPPASLMLKFGGIQWLETSPLTVWEYQRRLFAWDYLPYEGEEPIITYYDKNLIKGERTGRAAWNKKPFNGIGLESINLPYDLFLNMFYGCIEPFDRHEREYIDLQGELAFYSVSPATEAKGFGIGDSYRHALLGRLAGTNAIINLTPGINFLAVRYDPDITSNQSYLENFDMGRFGKGNRSFYKEPWVFSADVRGKITDSVDLHFDAAIGEIDTSFFLHDSLDFYTIKNRVSRPSGIKPALYTGIKSTYLLPMQIELIYAAPGFYSPFSFTKSVDGFSPFGANLVGPGNYITSAYNQNLTGFNVHLSPLGSGTNGHCTITYGNHRQVKEGPDVLYFPYRLNGADLFSVFQSSCSRWGMDLVDFSIINPTNQWNYFEKSNAYQKRIGDESYRRPVWGSPYGPEAGGLRSQQLEIYEGFVPYTNPAEAQANLTDTSATVFQRSKYIPHHKKYTFNLEMDAAYDISTLFQWKNSVFLSSYMALNGVSTAPLPVAVNEKSDDMLLWGAFIRLEPAISLSEKFFLLGLAGFENWRAAKAWMADSSGTIIHTPIDFRDVAWGLGFDWQILERVGLHGRCKWMQHNDVNYNDNNWETPIVSSEIKMYF